MCVQLTKLVENEADEMKIRFVIWMIITNFCINEMCACVVFVSSRSRRLTKK
jgi:hypothetical protein